MDSGNVADLAEEEDQIEQQEQEDSADVEMPELDEETNAPEELDNDEENDISDEAQEAVMDESEDARVTTDGDQEGIEETEEDDVAATGCENELPEDDDEGAEESYDEVDPSVAAAEVEDETEDGQEVEDIDAEDHEINGDGEEAEADDGEKETNNNNHTEEQEDEQPQSDCRVLTRKRSASHSSVDEGPKKKQVRSGSVGGRKRDCYCWVCHKDGVQAFCKICPRSYHFKCMHLPDEPPPKGLVPAAEPNSKHCICPECAVIMNAENLETRSEAMKQLNVDQLINMLKNACQRMKNIPGVEPFLNPVDPEEAVDYFTYIVHPMDLYTLEKNVKQRFYGSTEAFLADAQWLVHNSIVFNSASSPFTIVARRILKTCKQEIQEIETCPECYDNAHHKPDCWFIEACKRPHILVWAKLKGFPFWPAKAMKIKDEQVDVRFFGQHDRAWVCMKDCFLYSEEMPGAPPKRNNQLQAAIEELNAHIEKLKARNNCEFIFAPVKTPIGPQLSVEQIRKMLPEYKANKAEDSNPDSKPKAVTPAQQQQQPPKSKQPPMTIRISSLKTNPTIVNSSVVLEESTNKQNSNKPTLRIRKSAAPSSSPHSSVSAEEIQPKSDFVELETEEKQEQVREADQKEAVPEETDSITLPTKKGSEILANALGQTRSTRRSSRAETISPGNNVTEQTAPSVNGERRLTRSVNKSITNDSGEEDSKVDELAEVPPDFLQAVGLRKASDPVVKAKPPPALPATRLVEPADVVIKGEPVDTPPDEEYEDINDNPPARRPAGVSVGTSQKMMTQFSGGQKAGGLRFNLSKDISISAVGESGQETGGNKDIRPKKPVALGSNNVGRMPPGLIPQNLHNMQQMVGVRPRQMQNANGGGGGMGNQRLAGHPQQQQHRLLTRPLRPGGQQMRPGMKITGPRPSMQMMHGQMKGPGGVQKSKDNNNQPIVVESSSLRIDGSNFTTATSTGIQMNQVQSLQGAITLPGGTITVTPLAPLIGVPITTYGNSGDGGGTVNGGHVGSVVTLKSNQTTSVGLIQHSIAATTVTTANGLPISVISPHDGSQSHQQKANKLGGHPRRNIMNQIPPSVGHLVQNLQKNLVEAVKSSMEQIVVEMVENSPGIAGGGAEIKALKEDIDKLRKQLIDTKHNNDVSIREIKLAMENDKKRALNEMRRQLEHDKIKAVEETKKKQWCARCGREAQFYCCWNTSYCGYACQEDHWPSHMNSCSQSNAGGGAR